MEVFFAKRMPFLRENSIFAIKTCLDEDFSKIL